MNQYFNHVTARIAAVPVEIAERSFGSPESRSALLRYAVKVTALFFALALLGIGAVVVMVLSGPTELGFLRNRIASTLTAAVGEGYDVSVGSAALNLDPVYGLVLEVDNVAVRDGQGAIVANVPSTRLDLDPTALLSFDIKVPAIELNHAELSIARTEDGGIYLGNPSTTYAAKLRSEGPSPPPNDSAGPGFPQLHALFKIFDSGIEPGIERAVENGLRRFALNSGTIEFWDAARDEFRRFPRADLAVAIDPVSTALSASFATIGHGGRWSAEFERDVDVSSGAWTLSAVFSQLTLADIMPKLGQGTGRVTADIPLYGRATVRYDSEGRVEDATARLDLGAGTLRFFGGQESVLLDEATVKLRWDVSGNAIVIRPSTFFLGETRGVVVGRISPVGDPAIGRYQFDLESRGAVLAPRDTTEPPLIAQHIRASGMADLPEKLISFDDVLLQTAQGSIAAAGSLSFDGETPSLAVAASVSELPTWAAKQIWVPFLAPGARRWFLAHVKGGRIAGGTFEAAIPAGRLWSGEPLHPDDLLRLDVRLADVAFATVGELPPIENADGVAVLAGSTFGIDLESGVVRVPSGKTVNIDAGAFAVDDVSAPYPEGVIEMLLSGAAEPLGEIADAKPFEALSKLEIVPSDLSGAASASVSVRLPLRPDVAEADVDWKVSIDGTGLASAAPLFGYMVTDADVYILASPFGITVRGTAKIDGVDADIDLSRPIADGELPGDAGQQMVRLNLDDAARRSLGIGLDDVLSGSVATYVSNVENGEGQHYDLDLRNARLVLPGLGWSKGIGVPASLSFDLVPKEAGYSVENLVLEGAGFGFSGTAVLDSDYGIVAADIGRFSLRAGDSLRFTLQRVKTGYAISAGGKAFDIRGFIESLRQPSDVGVPPDLSIEAKVERLIGFNDEEIRDARVSLISAGGVTRKLEFSGKIGDGEIVATYGDNGDTATLSLESADGGRVMRFGNLYSRIGGGYLRVGARRSEATGPLVGALEMTNFSIVGEPAMKRVVSTASSRNGDGRSSRDPSNVRFDRLVVNFAKTGQAITVREALLRGATIGATFNGRFDLASSSVSINGTYLPAYQFNNFFGRLPIVGLALGGGAAGGLIGVTFKIQGPTDKPQVFINPLSAVAPGIFRKIFEFQ